MLDIVCAFSVKIEVFSAGCECCEDGGRRVTTWEDVREMMRAIGRRRRSSFGGIMNGTERKPGKD